MHVRFKLEQADGDDFLMICAGISMDDNPFDWERRLRRKFRDNILIIKAGTDINADWPDASKRKRPSFMQRMPEAMNNQMPPAARPAAIDSTSSSQFRMRCLPN